MSDTPRQYGYDQGDPFGDPSHFTRSTQEDEINRFNEWMRSQPWWQTVRAQAGDGNMNDAQQQQIVTAAHSQGISVPKDFHIDEAGNFNQKSRTKRNLIIGAAIAGAVVTGGMLAAAAGPTLGSTAALGPVAATGGTTAAAVPAALAGGSAASGIGGVAGAIGTGARLAGVAQAGSRMLGAFGETEAQNRGSQAELALAGDRAKLEARVDTRLGEADAMKKLSQTNYLLNHQESPLPPGARDYGFTQAPSDAQKQSAQVLQEQMQKRIAEGGLQTQDYQQYGTPGKGERLAGLLSPALGLFSDYYGRR